MFRKMNTVEEIERAIQSLPQQQAWRIANWLNAYLDDDWDREMKRDAQPGGKLDRYIAKIKEEVKAGKSSEIRC